MSEILLFIAVLIIMIIGLIGTVAPMLPGIPIIYLGYVIHGIITHWQHYGLNAMIFWGIITLLMILLDYYAGALGAKKYGASTAGVVGSIIGGILGVILLGFIGLIAGPILGAVFGELLMGKTQKEAWRSGWGSLIGFFVGSLFKIVVGLIMIGTFCWWVIL